MKRGWWAAGLALLGAAGVAIAQDSGKDAGSTLPPPAPAERTARAAASLADYRYDDILWENDRIAHRIYGHALEAVEPPSSSGIDVWGKRVRWPFMVRQLHAGDQHNDHGEGVDFYNVHSFRGAGGLGIWYDNKLWVSRNYVRYRMIDPGPRTADFQVDYAPWPVDVGRKVWETRRFTLPAGTNFTRLVSTIRSDRPDGLIVGIGVSKRATSVTKLGTVDKDAKNGRLTWWSPPDPRFGSIGVAIMVDPAKLAGFVEDYDHYIVLVRVTPGEPFVYYMGAAWDHGLDFHSQGEWKQYVDAQHPDFTPPR